MTSPDLYRRLRVFSEYSDLNNFVQKSSYDKYDFVRLRGHQGSSLDSLRVIQSKEDVNALKGLTFNEVVYHGNVPMDCYWEISTLVRSPTESEDVY